MPSQSAGSNIEVPAWERYALTAIFGSLIGVGFAYQASTMATTLGWVAYPLVGVIGVVSFVIARVAWLGLTAELQAHVERTEHIDGDAS